MADDAGIQNEKDIDQSTYYEDSDSDHVASNVDAKSSSMDFGTSLNQTASLSPLYDGNTPEEVEEKKGSSSIDNSSQRFKCCLMGLVYFRQFLCLLLLELSETN